jgi:hypothetical protein
MRNPGLISTLFRLVCLTGFQLFFVLLLFKALLLPKIHTRLRFNLLPELSGNYSFLRDDFIKQLQNKRILYFNLCGIKEQDNILIEEADLETRKLVATCDSLHVIKVHFSPGNTYGQFVQLVNIAKLEMAERYTYIDDDFYIFGSNCTQ